MLVAQQAHYVAALEPTRQIVVAHVGAGAERALAADRLKREQTLARMRTSGRRAQRVGAPHQALPGFAPDVAHQTVRAPRDAGIVAQPGRGESRIFDPLLQVAPRQARGSAWARWCRRSIRCR